MNLKQRTMINCKENLFYLIVIMLSLTTTEVWPQGHSRGVILSVSHSAKTAMDSVQLKIWDDYVDGGYSLASTKTCNLKIDSLAVFSLPDFKKQRLFAITAFVGKQSNHYPLLPVNSGDKVQIKIDGDKLIFSGKGAAKMQATFELDTMDKKFKEQYETAKVTTKDTRYPKNTLWGSVYHYLNMPLDSILMVKLSYLNRFKEMVSLEDYQQLKANTITADYYSRIYKFNVNKDYAMSVDSTKIVLFKEMFDQKIRSLYPRNVQDSFLASSPTFSSFLILKWRLASEFDKSFKVKYKDALVYSETLPTPIRERFVISYLLRRGIQNLDENLANKALNLVQSPFYLSYFRNLQNNVKSGDMAYDFTLEDSRNRTVKLSDFKGKVVFMDFWFTGCRWCKEYYKQTLKNVQNHYRGSNDIVFLSICIDKIKDTWLGSVEEGTYTGVDEINLYTQGAGSNHQLLRHYGVKGYPTQIIIDRNMRNYNVNNGIQSKSSQELIQYLDNLIKLPINEGIK